MIRVPTRPAHTSRYSYSYWYRRLARDGTRTRTYHYSTYAGADVVLLVRLRGTSSKCDLTSTSTNYKLQQANLARAVNYIMYDVLYSHSYVYDDE
eukprot:scaffold369628_cov18-Prasinocladus_malaysianus.AAC.1